MADHVPATPAEIASPLGESTTSEQAARVEIALKEDSTNSEDEGAVAAEDSQPTLEVQLSRPA